MNVLIYGAGNSIAISLAQYLHKSGHNAILSDVGKHFRAFYSRSCHKKYIFRDPECDRDGFSVDLIGCMRQEDVELLLPTSDRALFHLLSISESIPKDIKVSFPLENEKVNRVVNKKNIPSICEQSGIGAITTCFLGKDFKISDFENIRPPYALKLAYGVSGKGFKRIDSLKGLQRELSIIKSKGLEEEYIIQRYLQGQVYGAGGVFENDALTHFFSYRYIRRYPESAGNSTLRMVDFKEKIEQAMYRVLKTLEWKGFCHMDFVLDEKDKVPYLLDINPVHCYTVPNSLSKELNCLNYYLDTNKEDRVGGYLEKGHYSTISLTRELQRIVTGGILRTESKSRGDKYWGCLRGLRHSDFYWDPLPIVLAPFLRFLRSINNTCCTKDQI